MRQTSSGPPSPAGKSGTARYPFCKCSGGRAAVAGSIAILFMEGRREGKSILAGRGGPRSEGVRGGAESGSGTRRGASSKVPPGKRPVLSPADAERGFPAFPRFCRQSERKSEARGLQRPREGRAGPLQRACGARASARPQGRGRGFPGRGPGRKVRMEASTRVQTGSGRVPATTAPPLLRAADEMLRPERFQPARIAFQQPQETLLQRPLDRLDRRRADQAQGGIQDHRQRKLRAGVEQPQGEHAEGVKIAGGCSAAAALRRGRG